MNSLITFAAGDPAPSGIAALGINVQAFLFQLIAFLIVLWILKRFAFGPLVKTLESRRQAVIDSLDNAKETADKLEQAQKDVATLIDEARSQAETIVATAHKEAISMVEVADKKASKRAEHIILAAEARLEQDVIKARAELRQETMELVTLATETIIRQKLDGPSDERLIKEALKVAK